MMIFLYKYLGFFFLLLSLLIRMLLVEAKQSFKTLWSIRVIPFSQVKLQFLLRADQLPAAQLLCASCLAALRIRPLIAAFRSITFVPVLMGVLGGWTDSWDCLGISPALPKC